MQKIEFLHDVTNLAPTAERLQEYATADESDFITDEDEIRATIRRAVTMSWQDSVFTLDELHGHLIKNFIKLPVPESERNEWLEAVIYDIWQTRRELARVANGVLPTIINRKMSGAHYYGIVEPQPHPNENDAPVYNEPEPAPAVIEALIEETNEPCESNQQYAPVASIVDIEPELAKHETPAILTRHSEIAAKIFEQYIQSNEAAPRFEVVHLMKLFCNQDMAAKPKDVRHVIKIMTENGYIRSYTTGKNKSQRTWWGMDADIKQEIVEQVEEGSLDQCLQDIFDDEEAVA